jgi:hypothetical protein
MGLIDASLLRAKCSYTCASNDMPFMEGEILNVSQSNINHPAEIHYKYQIPMIHTRN